MKKLWGKLKGKFFSKCFLKSKKERTVAPKILGVGQFFFVPCYTLFTVFTLFFLQKKSENCEKKLKQNYNFSRNFFYVVKYSVFRKEKKTSKKFEKKSTQKLLNFLFLQKKKRENSEKK